ncbi:MAG TPA: hypothetical protein VFS20_07230 [Longimicrobium sp.]|nr:hypothetical protein [Longimicrobium sp.]
MSTRIETPAGGIADPRAESLQWWEDRRGAYNRALVLTGIGAFLAWCGAVELCIRTGANVDVEITIFSIVGYGIGYLLAMGLANVCYGLGALAERVARPADGDRFRRRLYGVGLAFSVALPWIPPTALVVQCALAPGTAAQVSYTAAVGR